MVIGDEDEVLTVRIRGMELMHDDATFRTRKDSSAVFTGLEWDGHDDNGAIYAGMEQSHHPGLH